MKDEQTSLQQIIDHRNKKLVTMKENGINPFPHKFNYSHKSKEILTNFESLESKCVKVAGRIMAIRKMGKASFAQILDSEGRIQIFIKKDDVGENSYNNFKLLDIGDFVGVEGNIFKTKTKEISIRTDKITVLAKSIRPLPIVKEKDYIVNILFKKWSNDPEIALKICKELVVIIRDNYLIKTENKLLTIEK